MHVRHRSPDETSVFWPHQQGFEFKSAFQPQENKHLIEKSSPCTFIGTKLEAWLRTKNISGIVLTGAATNNSIESTVRTAGNLGFDVILPEDACFCFAKSDYFGKERSAEEVHAISLANLNVEYAKVISTSDLLR